VANDPGSSVVTFGRISGPRTAPPAGAREMPMLEIDPAIFGAWAR